MESLIQNYLKQNNLTGKNGVDYTLRNDGEGVYIDKWNFSIVKPSFSKEELMIYEMEIAMEIAKTVKFAEIKTKKYQALNENIEFDGKLFPCSIDITQSSSVCYAEACRDDEFKFKWRLADDVTWVYFDKTKAAEFCKFLKEHLETVYEKETNFKKLVINATNIEDINNIIVNY